MIYYEVHMRPKLTEKRIVQDLRRQGLSYNEILQKVSVAKSSVSLWCQDIELTNQQKERLNKKRKEHLQGLGPLLALKRQKEICRIKEIAKKQISCLTPYEFKIAGAMLYWAEGTKAKGHGVEITNSDPEMIKFMIHWFKEVLGVSPKEIKACLNIHINQDDETIKRYWSEITGISLSNFGKSYIKPEGTGHRKNLLHNGVIRIRVGGGNLRQRVMAWIKMLSEHQSL